MKPRHSRGAMSKPTLYRESDDKRLAQWRVWVTEDDDGRAFVHTEWGKVDGKLQRGSREITEPGRKATVLEAARHHADKKWKDKQSKEGYSAKRATAAAAQHADGPPAKKARRKSASGKSASKGAIAEALEVPVLPMLANTAKIDRDADAVKGITWPAAAQPKIDGFRCVARVTGGAKLFSRKNVEYQGLPSLRAAIDKLRPPKAGFGSGRLFLDGELYVDTDGDFGRLSSAVKKGQTRPGWEVEGLVYRVFDCLDLDHMDTAFAERHEFLAGLLERADPALELLETAVVGSVAEVDAKMAEWLADGNEGLMLRELGSPYVLRKRAKWLVKHKEFIDAEFEIVGHKEGAGADAGTVIWVCKTTDGAQTFSVRPMGTREHRAELLAHASDYYGRPLTVKYQELSPDGVPRFPVGKWIREDWDLAAAA